MAEPGTRAGTGEAGGAVRVASRADAWVRAGLGATIQPGAAAARDSGLGLRRLLISDRAARRVNLLASVSEEELSPAALAARVVLRDQARSLVAAGGWPGATLHEP